MLNVFSFCWLLDLCCFHLPVDFCFFFFLITQNCLLSFFLVYLPASIWLVDILFGQRAAGFGCAGILSVCEGNLSF